MNNYFNIEAENLALGSMIEDNKCLDLTTLKEQHFYNSDNRLTYSIMRKKYKELGSISYETLATLGRPISNYISTVNQLEFEGVEKELIKLYKKRQLKSKLNQSLNNLEDKEPEEVLNSLNELNMDLTTSNNKLVSLDSAMCELIESFDKPTDFLKTGIFPRLDTKVKPFRRGYYTVIGGFTGSGKSAIACEYARVLSKKYKGIYFNIEMENIDLIKRLTSSELMIDYGKLQEISLPENPEEEQSEEVTRTLEKLIKGAHKVTNENLKLVSNSLITIEEIERTCRIQKNREGLDFIVVDYITIIQTEKTFPSIRERIIYISNKLRSIAKELKISVIALSQLDKRVEFVQPQTEHLVESASIGHDAHVIMMLYNETGGDSETMDREARTLYITKNRNGEKYIGIKLKFMGRYQHFYEK